MKHEPLIAVNILYLIIKIFVMIFAQILLIKMVLFAKIVFLLVKYVINLERKITIIAFLAKKDII